MAQFRYSLSFEWRGKPLRVTLLARSLSSVGSWLDRQYPGVTEVRIERADAE